MSSETVIRVLLIEDSESDVLLVRENLLASRRLKLEVDHAESLSEGTARLREASFDVVLLDLGLPDSEGIATFCSLRDALPKVLPVVVLTGGDDASGVEAVRLGAQDFVEKSDLSSRVLDRVIEYAIERHRLQRELERRQEQAAQAQEIRSMERLATPPATGITAESYGSGSLRERASDVFASAVEQYERLLDHLVEKRVLKIEALDGIELQLLGEQLGRAQAGPRDVIELHLAALRRKMADSIDARAHAYLEVSRGAVLELMGYLAAFYRPFFRRERRHT